MKKLFLLSLCILLLSAFTVSAAGGKQSIGGATAPMEISWFGLYGGKGDGIEDGNEVQLHLEEKFNVKLTNKQIAYTEKDKVRLMISSGEHTDFTYAFVEMVDFFAKGAFRSIPKDMLTKYGPEYSKMIGKSGEMAWKLGLAPGKDDEYMGFVRSMDYKVGSKYMPLFRLDYMEKAGIKVDGLIPFGARALEGKSFWTKEVMTAQQFEQILYLFRDGDFDGNGKDDTIAWGCMNAWNFRGLDLLATLYGLNGVDNYNDNGKTVKMAVHSQFKEMLKKGQQWFKDKLMDSELPAVDKAAWEDKIKNGITASWQFAPDDIGLSNDPNRDGNIPYAIVVRNPNAKTVMTLNPIGFDGKHTTRASVGAFALDAAGLACVKAGVSDEKLAKIIEIYDYVNFDDYGMLYTQYGTAGVNFNWAGEPGNSYPVSIDGKTGLGQQWGFGYYNGNTRPDKLFKRYQIPPLNKPVFQYFQYEEGAKPAIPAYREDVLGETDYIDALSKYRGALDTLRDEFTWKAITTDMNIDAEWDAYVQKWLNSGGQKVHDELAKMPQVMSLRAGKLVY